MILIPYLSLETLEEMAEENKANFIESGGEDYNYIPCLNDGDAQIELITTLIKSQLRS